MSSGELIRARARVLLTELPDGNGVILDLDSKLYFALNATALAVWRVLEGGSAVPRTSLVGAVTSAFDVEPGVAEKDVSALVTTLAREGLVDVALP